MPRTKSPSMPRARRWTREEYARLAEQGYFRRQRVELIEGEIVQMPAMKNLHAIGISLTERELSMAFGPNFWVRPQMPLILGPRSEPEPDVSVVPGQPRDYTDHPTTALTLVEVSDATLAYDRGKKGRICARAQIPDYWILNLLKRQLEVYRDPQPDPLRPGQFFYAQRTILGPGEFVTPLAAPGARIAVSDLLP
jgi:Uma2 family endonuclease